MDDDVDDTGSIRKSRQKSSKSATAFPAKLKFITDSQMLAPLHPQPTKHKSHLDHPCVTETECSCDVIEVHCEYNHPKSSMGVSKAGHWE